MKTLALLAVAILLATSPSVTQAKPVPRAKLARDPDMVYGAPVGTARTVVDTTYLLGGPGSYDGKFQDAAGNPDWQGWTHEDVWYHDDVRWHVSTFNQPTGGGNFSCWCGRIYPTACGAGYGIDWNEDLVFSYTVDDPDVATTVNLSCIFNVDTEQGWDYFKIQFRQGNNWTDVVTPYSGLNTNVQLVNQPITFNRSDYVDGQLQLRLHADSDHNTCDQDCLLDTNGHTIIDNIVVAIQGGPTFTEDFEDQTIDDWEQVFFPGVGDFSQIWIGLDDLDPCHSNLSPQVAFIDDGVVVPGVGPTLCTTWCYGPNGYIVNNTGGLTFGDPDYYLNNIIESPYLTWPANADAATLSFDVYRHESISYNSPFIFYQWHVRSIQTGDTEDLDLTIWRGDGQFYYGGPEYVRETYSLSSYLVPARTHIQVSLRCIEQSWFWYDVHDGTPAPYFDNVQVVAFPLYGPEMSGEEIELAQDNFPERGVIDLENLANDFIRFDMGRNISPSEHLRNDPGDSIVFRITLPRAGSVLDEMPRMAIKMKSNPLFDGVRVLPPGFTQIGDIVDGWVYGDSTFDGGEVVPDIYHFDLPDSNFFFPGDVIHYYLEAKDDVAGDVGTSRAPADISGFADFTNPLAYGSPWTVRGLPTVLDASGNQPRILFWNDFGNHGGKQAWVYALNNLGYREGVDYDEYDTNGPTAGAGNGLGGRATANAIGGYDVLMYTSGDMCSTTIGNGDYASDPSADLQLLDGWFQSGGKHGFFTGDRLVRSLRLEGTQGRAFVDNYFGVDYVTYDVAQLIGNQTSPVVRAIGGNGLFADGLAWVACGLCPSLRRFEGITAGATAMRLAEFLAPDGQSGVYPYAAAVRKVDVADCVLLPYGFAAIVNAPDFSPPDAAIPERAYLLRDFLIAAGVSGSGEPIGVPDAGVFSVGSYPNPFNPRLTIKLHLPRAGDVSLKVFNVRGELVRTLVHGRLEAGERAFVWDGSSDRGAAVASGVYFYEARANGTSRIGKMTLVR